MPEKGSPKELAEQPELAIADIVAEGNIRPVDGASPEFKELVASITTQGIIEPLVVRRRPDDRYDLVAGFRRFAAAKAAKLLVVPVRLMKLDDQQAAEARLVENLQRQDLSPMEEARALTAYATLTGAKAKEIGQRLGMSESFVRERVNLTKLPEKVQGLIDAGKLTSSHGEALLKLPDDEEGRRVMGELALRASQWVTDPKELERSASHAASQIRDARAFQSERDKSEHAGCPTCKKKAVRFGESYEGGKGFFLCPEGHRWSAKTGKAPAERTYKEPAAVAERRQEARAETIKENERNNAESPTMRSYHTPATILGAILKELGPDAIGRVRLSLNPSDDRPRLTVDFESEKSPIKLASMLDFYPAAYSTGHHTAVVVVSRDAAGRKAGKKNYGAWEKDSLAAPKEPKAKDPVLAAPAIEELLKGTLGDVVPRIHTLARDTDDPGRTTDTREKLELIREVEVEGKARGGVVEAIDHELGISNRGYDIE